MNVRRHIILLVLSLLLSPSVFAQTSFLKGYDIPIIPVSENPPHKGDMRFGTVDMDSILSLMIPQTELQKLSETESLLSEVMNLQESLPVEGRYEQMRILEDPDIPQEEKDSILAVFLERENAKAEEILNKYLELEELRARVILPHWERLEIAARKVASENNIDIVITPKHMSDQNYGVEKDLTPEVIRELGLAHSPR